jgi:hypothetical protein
MDNISVLLVLILCTSSILCAESDEADAEEVSGEEDGSGDADIDDEDYEGGESGENENWEKYGEEMKSMQRASWKLNHGKPNPKAGKNEI